MNINYYTTPLIRANERLALEERPIEAPPRSRILWITRTVMRLLWQHRRAKRATSERRQAHAVKIREFFESMGGIWIKVGQVLAMRTDLFSIEFCREMARLQDRSITFSAQRSMEIVAENLGRPLDEVFDIFEETPFAAASLSQAHKARLRDSGEWVVVKVQRPYALETFHYDYRWLTRYARVLKFLGIAKNFRLDRMLEEVRQMMLEELDYRHEASNMRRLRASLAAHRVIVPRVYVRYTTDRVLVMEYLEGVFMSDFIAVSRTDPARAKAWLLENDIDGVTVSRRLFQSVMRQLFEDLFFHADLHPGNIILLRENRLAFIDFGNCGMMDRKLAAQYDQYFRAMAEHALDKAADLLLLILGQLPPMDIDAFKKRVIRALAKQISKSYVHNLPYREKSIGSNSAELNQIMAEFNIEVNWEVLKMARAFESVDQNISVLNPNFNFAREMGKYQERAKRRKKQIQLQQLPNLLDQISDFAQIIVPSLMQRSMTFSGSVGKGIQIAAAVFSVVKKVLIVGLFFTFWFYLHQHHNRLVNQLEDEENDFLTKIGLAGITKAVPVLTREEWFFAGALLLVFIFALSRFVRNLLAPDKTVIRTPTS